MDIKEINTKYAEFVNRKANSPAIDVMPINGSYYYINKGVKVSGPYDKAGAFCDGLAVIKENYEDKYHYIDTNFQQSQDEYAFARDYSCGYAAVCKDSDGERNWQYRDVNGNLSEHFYATNDYSCGFAAVMKDKFSLWQYRNSEGQLSKLSFVTAKDFVDGFGLVTMINGEMRFADTEGNYSEGFNSALSYHNGFAMVAYTSNPLSVKYRDILGNVTNTITDLGQAAYLYANNQIQLTDIPNNMFLDDKFVALMIKHEQKEVANVLKCTNDIASAKSMLEGSLCYIDEQASKAAETAQAEVMSL